MNKKSLLSIFLTAIMIGGLFLVSTVHFGAVQAFTDVAGLISSDTTWTNANSPYNLTGNVLVNNGITLTIQSGVSVNLNSYYIMINGTLYARGNSTEQIFINGGQVTFTQFSTDWNESTNTGCIIENAFLNSTLTLNNSPKISNDNIYSAINIQNTIGIPIISNNTIHDGISVSSGGMPIIANNTFLGSGISLFLANATVTGNTISGSPAGITVYTDYSGYGWFNCTSLIDGNLIIGNTNGIIIREQQGSTLDSPIVRNNTITNNTIGISLTWIGISGPRPSILNNNIYNNSNYNIQSSLSNDINATFNWWGTTNTQAINQTIYDFKNDFNLGRVTFVPFLTEPNSAAPAIPTEPSPTATYVTGLITSNTTWALFGSPYVVTGNVVVDSNVFLTVEPGVTVRFTGGTGLIIDGTLIAQGNSTHKIVFTRDSSNPTSGYWNGILVRRSSVTLDNVIVEYATIGIELRANATLTHSVFRLNTIGINLTRECGLIVKESNISENSELGIRVFYRSHLEINDSFVTKNGAGIYGAGDLGPYSFVTARNCTISENTGDGLYLMGGTPGAVRITNCTVTSNGGHGLRGSSRDTILNDTLFCNNSLDGLNLMGYEDVGVIIEIV
ncbi:right-handed parallel beta-helix repeat-containing protein, partial [Candidatus Bathyarchaeota archaeon]|nr:right-handed parallel beta-helix repeat-containing protein [Candidatus Bathyarchaeota archaeon]